MPIIFDLNPLRVCRVCGLKAYTENDLQLFKKRTGYPYDRLTICKDCNNKNLKKPPTEYLRKCRVCGLEALTEEDLKRFTTHKRQPFGKDNICKKCTRKTQKEKEHHTNELLEFYRKISGDRKIYCYFCGEEITLFQGRKKTSLSNHSLDRNHDNWEHKNKVPAHFGCHGSYHANIDNTAQYLEKWRGSCDS